MDESYKLDPWPLDESYKLDPWPLDESHKLDPWPLDESPKPKKWQTQSKLTWHYFEGKINWFRKKKTEKESS